MTTVRQLRATEKRAKRDYGFAKRMQEYTPKERGKVAASGFMVRVGQHKRVTERRCQWTMPLFPLWLILDADGTLANDAARKVGIGR